MSSGVKEPDELASAESEAGSGYLTGSLSLMSRDLHRLFNRVLEEQVGRYGLAFNTCRYLGFIADAGSATPGELSESLGVRQPTTLAALRILQDKRLVRRTTDAIDRRKSQYHLTKRGAEIEQLIRDSAREMERQVIAQLTESQLAQFREITGVMHNYLEDRLNPQHDGDTLDA